MASVHSSSALPYKHKDNEDDLLGDGAEQVPSALQERLRELQRQEARYEAIEKRNWNRANWKQNGIAAWNATITQVLAMEDDEPLLVVGDASGIVSCVQWNMKNGGVPSQSVMEEDAPVDYEIVQQWKIGNPVQRLAADEEYVYASDGSVIYQWAWGGDEDDDERSSEPTATILSPCHTLQTISHDRLVAVHTNGASIWSSEGGALLGDFKTEETIACAAVDDEKAYLGMTNGDIEVYSLQTILDSGDTSPLARWRGTRDDSIGISALAVGGDTRIGSQMVKVLFAGDTDGGVKQWFLLPQNGGESLQPWPKLSTQRLPKKAHVFRGHTGRVESILAVDGVKFVSSAVDSTIKGWNTATGKEIFSMEGFPTAVDSLATMDGYLVTNGMDQYLPLNDFTVDDDDFDLDMPEYIE